MVAVNPIGSNRIENSSEPGGVEENAWDKTNKALFRRISPSSHHYRIYTRVCPIDPNATTIQSGAHKSFIHLKQNNFM